MKKHNAGVSRKMKDICINRTRLMLVFAMLMLCLPFSGCDGREVNAFSGNTIVSFEEDQISVITVNQGTAAQEIELPEVLAANIAVLGEVNAEEPVAEESVMEGPETMTEAAEAQGTVTTEPCNVPVCWECANYDADKAGEYVFAAMLASGYAYEGEMPAVTVEVLAAVETEQPDAPSEPQATKEVDVIMQSSAEETEPMTGLTAEPGPSNGPVSIAGFTNGPIEFEVPRGTVAEDIPLPVTLPAINKNGDAIEVPVTWTNGTGDTDEYENAPNSYETGSLYGYGPWTFTASVDAAYAYTGEPVTASVSIPNCKELQNFCGITTGGLLLRFVIFEGETVNLPTEVGAFMADGGYRNIPVSWGGSYDMEKAGTYELTMSIEGGYTGGGASAEIVVMQAVGKQQGGEQ